MNLRALAGLVAVCAGCTSDPVPGNHELAFVAGAQELVMGRTGTVEVTAPVRHHPDAVLQSYVDGIGQSLAKRTARPQLDWEFRVVDDAAINSFSRPDGYVVVTRGLLTHLNSEAELAGVLGHEAGHVVERHATQSRRAPQLSVLGDGVGALGSATLVRFVESGNARPAPSIVEYRREEETEADRLGFDYALSEGYDPRKMRGLFAMLQRHPAPLMAGGLPSWQTTHADPGDRLRLFDRRVDASSVDPSLARDGSEEFLRRIDGLVYGEDPRSGYFNGVEFVHPRLLFTVRFPDGWSVRHGTDVVTGISPSGDAVVHLRGSPGTPRDAAQAFFGPKGPQRALTESETEDGQPVLAAEFVASMRDGAPIAGAAHFVEYRGVTWRIIGYSHPKRFDALRPELQRVADSFGRLAESSAIAVEPQVISVMRVPHAMSLGQFASQYPSDIAMHELATLNGIATSANLSAGQFIKRVVRASQAQVALRP